MKGAPVARPVAGDGVEPGIDLGLETGVDELKRAGFLEDELLEPAGRHDADAVTGNGAGALPEPLGLGHHPDQAALDLARARGPDLGALQRVQQRRRRSEVPGLDRQAAEYLVERFAPGEADGGGAAALVEDDDALQHVVHLIEPDDKRKLRVAGDHHLVFEIADAAARQHDPLERQGLGADRGAGDGAKQGKRECQGQDHDPASASGGMHIWQN